MFDSDITIQGGPFAVPVDLKGILSRRMNLVYGRNGCGKTSIARAFREQQVNGISTPVERIFKLSSDGSGSLPPEVQNHLYVFNEDFIDNSVKFSKDGLKSIVRIGSSVQLDGPIQAAKDKISELEGKRNPLAQELVVLEGNKDKSIAEADKALRNGLKSADGFIERLSWMEGKRSNLTPGLFATIISTDITTPGTFSVNTEKAKLKAGIDKYLALQGGNLVLWQAPDLSGIPDLDGINALLDKVVRPAELNAEEQAILDDVFVVLASEDFAAKTQKLIVEDDRTICPLCHQPISPEHKHTLAERLLRFRNLQEEEFKDQVDAARNRINRLPETLPALPVSQFQADLDRGRDAITALNAFLGQVRDFLDKKYSNTLSPQPAFDKQALEALVSDCQSALTQLDADVTSYNQSLQEKKQLQEQLRQDNVTIAIYENLPWILEYNRRVARQSELKKEIARIDGDIADQEGIIAQLQGKMDRIDEAREQINKYLDIIFGQKKMRLANAGSENYKLQLRSGNTYEDIPPKAISSGERNALALAYFFACVMEKKDQDYAYEEPTLLVIDDPVSSFDSENKAGVISLLSKQCQKVLQGNPDSKVLIFTHDITTLRELCAQRSVLFKNDEEQTKYYLWLTQGRKLRSVNCNSILENMEYFSELNAIFGFAKTDTPEDYELYDSMGNTIRRFAESYATRMFRCSWNALFNNKDRLEPIPKDLRDRISSFAIRPVLNSESHSVIEEFEPSEVQRAARVLLIYIFYASGDHLRAYLNDDWKMKLIENWASDI